MATSRPTAKAASPATDVAGATVRVRVNDELMLDAGSASEHLEGEDIVPIVAHGGASAGADGSGA